MEDRVDVVVIGAGLAGLTSAWRLTQAGVNVRVVEARDRVGGRLHGYEVDGRPVQLGGRWTGPGQDAVKSLAAELGIGVVQNLSLGDRAMQGEDWEGLDSLARTLDLMAKAVPLESPWSTADAEQLDRQTLGTWLERNCSPPLARRAAETLAGFLPESQDVSLLHTLFYLHSNGGFASILGLDGPPHDSEMFEGGAHRLTDELYSKVDSSVTLGTPIYGLEHDESGVVVNGHGFSLSARCAIVTLPPTLAGRLHYSPSMPPDRDYLTQRMPIRGKIVVALLYEEAFWRESGTSLVMDQHITLWDEGGDQRPAALSGLVSIPRSRELGKLDAETRRRLLLDHVVQHLGPRARDVSSYHELNWAAEPWSRGCNSFMTTGTWTAWGHALREPVGCVHWAGAELSPRFVGQMDGAVRSAEITTSQVLESL